MKNTGQRRMKTAGYLLILISIVLTGSVAGAATVTWTNSFGGSWQVGSSWSSSNVPVPVDEVVIDLIGPPYDPYTINTITVDADVTISSLTMEAGALSLNAGTFVIDPSDMVLIPQGCFSMGDTFGGGYSNELPVHQVCLSSYSIDKYEVTQKAYNAVMGSNPSNFNFDDLPVDSVTWTEADSYCTAVGKRLPTEAEWEYAARDGAQDEKYAGTSIDADIGNYAWYSVNSGSAPHLVGQKLRNGFGTYDMSGNVLEWVKDWGGAYGAASETDPQGPATGTERVFRGGSWFNNAARASFRSSSDPGIRGVNLGFRCARTN